MLRALLLIPFLIVLVAFALSNPQHVQLALWPTDLSLEAPLSIAILAASGSFFFLGPNAGPRPWKLNCGRTTRRSAPCAPARRRCGSIFR